MFGWNRSARMRVQVMFESEEAGRNTMRPAPLGRKMRGQALILVVLALLVLSLGLLVLFDTGQVVAKKVQLTNTADAAAYSAAVQEARALNLIAYMNRASVANEVAMAQMVSWYSWTNFAISATDHLKGALGLLEILTAGTGSEVLVPAIEALQEAKISLEEGRDIEQKFFNAAAIAVAELNDGFSIASRVIADGTTADVVNVARKIVKLNDQDASISTIGWELLTRQALTASHYVVRHAIPKRGGSGDPGADRLKSVVMEARDPFSRQRDGSFFFGALKKYGGTDLVNYRSWVGLDTLNLKFNTGFPPEEKKMPIAWGGSAAVDRVTTSFASLAQQDQGWSGPYQGNDPQYASRQWYAKYSNALSNGDASDLALSQPAQDGRPWISPELGKLGPTVGLSDYGDIADDKATVPYENGKAALSNGVGAVDVGPKFTVLVALPINKVKTSSHVSGIGGPPDFQTTDRVVSEGITAMASSQVYFSRSRYLFPRLTDPGREIGSLFSPYWQARLVDTPPEIRLEVAAGYGLVAP
jgi:hypothetical protein